MPRLETRPLFLAALLAFAAVFANAAMPSGAPIRVALTLPLALVLPGYALSAALLPTPGGAAERLALSVGLSLATASLGGVALDLTPWGLRPLPWAVLLAATTIGAAAVAIARRSTAERPAARWVWPISMRNAILGGAAAALTIAAYSLANASASRQPAGFTQLWLLPGGATTVRLGVASRELTAATYRLTVTQEGRTLAQWPAITLAPGGSWAQRVVVPAGAGPVVADLFRQGSATPYRHVEMATGGTP